MAAPAAGPRTACGSLSCVATDDGNAREIAALTKKIAKDEEDLLEDRKVISHHAPRPPRSAPRPPAPRPAPHTRSAPRPPRVHMPVLSARPHESPNTRARQAKRELQLEIRALRRIQK